MKTYTVISKETQGFVELLQAASSLYEETGKALAAYWGEDAVDGLLAESGFNDKWGAVAEVLKGFLADAMFENIQTQSPEL